VTGLDEARGPDDVQLELREAPAGGASFRVLGQPQPKGSWRYVGGRAIPASDATGEWEQRIAITAADQARHLGGPLTGPLAVAYTFRVRMPAARAKVRRWREAEVVPCSVRPDLDKLERAVGDALQAGGLILNDAQIADAHGRKVEVVEGWTGVEIDVRQIHPLWGAA
jgi:crossover junction endodeoxyribonuclease RusA